MKSEFNLLYEPWIKVRTTQGDVVEVTLPEALINSHNYKDLSGESPTQDAAIFRLLLAVLYTVFCRYDLDGTSVPIFDADTALDRWDDLWNNAQFPASALENYFSEWENRFYLFDDTHPFFQVPEAKSKTQYNVAKLIGTLAESGNKLRLFPSHSGTNKESLSYAEAARWLLYLNSWDDTSLKKTRGIEAVASKGWLGNLGYIATYGDNLFETLMLNFVLLQDGEKLWDMEECIPVWELPKPKTAELSCIAAPRHPAKLLTTQFRRILLVNKDGAVTGYHLYSGDLIDKDNVFVEQQTLWKVYTDKEKTVCKPKEHDASRQLWREFSTIANTKKDIANTEKEKEMRHSVGIVQWLQYLQSEEILSKDKLICFKIAAIGYDSTASHTIQDSFSDSLTFHSNLLTEKGKEWCNNIDEQIQKCENAANTVGNLTRELCKASGISSEDKKTIEGKSNYAKEQFFARIDMPFREWLTKLSAEQSDEDKDKLLSVWKNKARQIALDLGRELVEQAGSAAFIGRNVTEKQKGKEMTRRYSAPEAYNVFKARIGKIYKYNKEDE